MFHECVIEDPVAQLAAVEHLLGTERYPFPSSVVFPSKDQLCSVLTSCNTVRLKRKGFPDEDMSGGLALSREWEPTDVCQRHVRGKTVTVYCLLRRSDGACFIDPASLTDDELLRLYGKLETVGDMARDTCLKRAWGLLILRVDAVFHGLHEWVTSIQIANGRGSLPARDLDAVSRGQDSRTRFIRIM
nr:hypothetical protein TetV2_00064 [Oceanusvirus sp.]